VAPSLFTPDQIADMQAEMNRFMRDYPNGDIPPEIIAEWEQKAEQARLGHEADDLSASIAYDETHDEARPKTRKQRAPRSAADRPPADMVPDTQDSAEVIRLNRADSKLAAQLARLYAVIGLSVTVLNQADGVLIMATAEDRAKELVLLANHHPNLKKALRSMTESNDYIIFAMGHGGLLVAILQNHGVMPQNIGASIARLFQRKPGGEKANVQN
jgi:hypothetical protein